jgi:hypothetical protein
MHPNGARAAKRAPRPQAQSGAQAQGERREGSDSRVDHSPGIAGVMNGSRKDRTMTRRKRIVTGIAALSLGLAFVLPLWRITLEAPQYPEGLGMHIRVNTITGIGRNDLQNINGLNHYVGMARIEPESFPELKYMPWILAGLMALGVAAAATGSRKVLIGWATVFAITAVVGLADFWKWEHDYGHNLDPTAAIKVPGLAYQPPLIGSKKLLNFTAHSWPAAGGWIVIGVFAVSVLAAATERRATA